MRPDAFTDVTSCRSSGVATGRDAGPSRGLRLWSMPEIIRAATTTARQRPAVWRLPSLPVETSCRRRFPHLRTFREHPTARCSRNYGLCVRETPKGAANPSLKSFLGSFGSSRARGVPWSGARSRDSLVSDARTLCRFPVWRDYSVLPQPQDSHQRLIHTPELFWTEMPRQPSQTLRVDRADLLNQHSGNRAVDLDLRAKRRRSGALRRRCHDHHGMGGGTRRPG